MKLGLRVLFKAQIGEVGSGAGALSGQRVSSAMGLSERKAKQTCIGSVRPSLFSFYKGGNRLREK